MVLNKALLAGLIGVSFCMADISGIVTDTGTTPLAGAVVKLEKGGQTATTGADGRFTLVIGTTGILRGDSKLLPNGLSARVSGTRLSVTLAERAAVEVETFNLGGKAISTVRKTLDAGINSITLPYRGTGVYLYKIKSGNQEFVLKGNTDGGVSSASALAYKGSSSNYLAKQSMVTAAMNDVIAATKIGYLNYRCVQYNSDTTRLQIKMVACADTVRDIEGNVYQAVRIGNQVWMTENLRVTKYNDGSAISLDTSTATWYTATTPQYCFYNNTTNSDSIKKFGALYNGYVVSLSNPKKIAPAGWHVPTGAEWETLQNYLIAKGYNWDGGTRGNRIAKSLAAQTDWQAVSPLPGHIGCDLTKNNRSGFSALAGGYRFSGSRFSFQGHNGSWWSVTEYGVASPAAELMMGSEYLSLYNFTPMGCGLSVRLLRD